MDSEQPDVKDMYGCMLAGDECIANLGEEQIFLVGETRVGKSTLFNLFMGRSLKVVKSAEEEEVYECAHKGAVMADGYESVTLLPNIERNVRFDGINTLVTLIDMAGYKDEGRSEVGVFGVSYMLKKAMQSAKKARFILVVGHSRMNLRVAEVSKAFQNFVDMLQVQFLIDNPEICESLISSVSLVVTKAVKKLPFYLKIMGDLVGYFEKKAAQNRTNNQEVILKLIKSIHENKRLQIFEAADQSNSEYAPPSEIIQNLYEPAKNWKPCRLDDEGKYVNKSSSIFQLPFKKDFEMMQTEHPEYIRSYDEAEKKKIECLKSSFSVLNLLAKAAMESWYIKGPIKNYSDCFGLIKNIIRQNNPYRSFPLMMRHLNWSLALAPGATRSVNELELLNKLVEIVGVAEVVFGKMEIAGQKDKLLFESREDIRKLLMLFKTTFCQTYDEEHDFIVFSFILWRSIYDCCIMIEIDGQKGSNAFFLVHDGINGLIEKSIEEIKTKFFIGFKSSDSNIDTYAKMLSETIEKDMSKITDPLQREKLYKIQIKNKIQKGDIATARDEEKDAISHYIEAISALDELKKLKEESLKEEDELYIEYQLIQIEQKIGFSLQKFGCFSMALKMFRHIRAISLIYNCYEEMIAKNSDPHTKYDYMWQYAQILSEHGRSQKAIEIYQSMLDTFYYWPKKKRAVMQELEKNFAPVIPINGEYREFITEFKGISYDDKLITDLKDEFDYLDRISIHHTEIDPDSLFEEQSMAPPPDSQIIE